MNLLSRFKFDKNLLVWIVSISAGMAVGITFILLFNPFNIKRLYEKPKAWIISQSLNSSLTKQQILGKSAQNGKVTIEDIARVATTSTTVKAEAVKIGGDFLLSTGANGQVSVNVTKGTYKIALIPIPGIDFTQVPEKITITGDYQLKIGLEKGSGKIKTKGEETSSLTNDNPKLTVILPLPWAGITIKLIKIN